MKEANNETVRDFVDAADVHGQYLYRKDGYILSYLRVYPFPISLMPKAEKEAKTDVLTACFKADRKDFDYCTLPMEIDMNQYKQNIKDKYKQQSNLGKRNLLNMMMGQVAQIVMNGENYEHYHYVRIWKLGSQRTKREVEEALGERIAEFEKWYTSIGIKCEILQEDEIIRICNLFGNPLLSSTVVPEFRYVYMPCID